MKPPPRHRQNHRRRSAAAGGKRRPNAAGTKSKTESLVESAKFLASGFRGLQDAFSPKEWNFTSAKTKAAAEDFATVLALVAFGGCIGAACVAALASNVRSRLAKRRCHRRNAMLLREADAFAGKVAAIAGAPQWDPEAYAKAAREFEEARRKIDFETAVAPRYRVVRDAEWARWMKRLGDPVVSNDRSAAAETTGKTHAAPLRAYPGLRRGAPIRKLCNWSVSAPPSGRAMVEQWTVAKGRGRLEEKIRLGSMLLDAEATVDSSLRRDATGEIIGRNPGLKGWIKKNCPELLPRYAMLMSCRRMASDFRLAHGVDDPVPAAVLLPGSYLGDVPLRLKATVMAEKSAAASLFADSGVKTARTLLERIRVLREARRKRFMEQMREFWRPEAAQAQSGGA